MDSSVDTQHPIPGLTFHNYKYACTVIHLHYTRSLPFALSSQQFFKNEYPIRHVCTARRHVYRSCLVCDTCVRELMVLDVPPQVSSLDTGRCRAPKCVFFTMRAHVCLFLWQKKFPADNLAEWNNGHPLGLRTVHAYVLVFDMGNLDTFQVRILNHPCRRNPYESSCLHSIAGRCATRFWRVSDIGTSV